MNRNGEYGKESWRKVALQESCSTLSPVIATVAAFVNSHRFFGSPPPLRGRGFCSFLMDLGGQVTVWLPRLGHKRPYSFCLGLWAYLLLECSPSESSLRAERAQATWEAMRRVLTDTRRAQPSIHPCPEAWPEWSRHQMICFFSPHPLCWKSASLYQLRPQTLWSRDKLSPLCPVWITDQQNLWAY